MRAQIIQKLRDSLADVDAPLDVAAGLQRRQARALAGGPGSRQKRLRGDFQLDPKPVDLPPDRLRPSAVLVPLIARPTGFSLLLTERAGHLKNHAGQISFPGGRIEAGDSHARATALRETEEEIGIAADKIQIVGRLDDYVTGTGFIIAPLVGIIEAPYTAHPDPSEVADVFEVPLDFCLDPANHVQDSKMFKGVARHFYAMTYQDRYIWGATAAMLVNLSEVLGR